MNRTLLCGALAAAALTAAPAVIAQTASMTMPTDAMGYITAAGQSDQFEIQEGQLAAQMASSPKVRDFGKMMVKDHTTSTRAVMLAAKNGGLMPPTAPPPLRADQRQMLMQLRNTSGAEFDRIYLMQQAQAHDQALMLHTNYAKNGDNTKLKAVANNIAGTVRQHISMIKSMMPAR